MLRLIVVTLLVSVAAGIVLNPIVLPVCPDNELWNYCGNSCSESKCNQSNIGVLCPAMCEARCECMVGHCRDSANKCVLI